MSIKLTSLNWLIRNECGTEGWDMLTRDSSLSLVSYYLSEAYQTLTIIQMHFVVHARKGRLLNHLLKQKTLYQPPNPYNYSILICLDQLTLHLYMEVNMD